MGCIQFERYLLKYKLWEHLITKTSRIWETRGVSASTTVHVKVTRTIIVITRLGSWLISVTKFVERISSAVFDRQQWKVINIINTERRCERCIYEVFGLEYAELLALEITMAIMDVWKCSKQTTFAALPWRLQWSLVKWSAFSIDGLAIFLCGSVPSTQSYVRLKYTGLDGCVEFCGANPF